MEGFSQCPHISRAMLRKANAVCIYLRVVIIADLVDVGGTFIPAGILTGKWLGRTWTNGHTSNHYHWQPFGVLSDAASGSAHIQHKYPTIPSPIPLTQSLLSSGEMAWGTKEHVVYCLLIGDHSDSEEWGQSWLTTSDEASASERVLSCGLSNEHAP